MKSTKVRFNLARGKNYMKWKIVHPSGEVEHHSPTDVQLLMTGCTLKNSRITAEKIFNGQHKVVCAWVLCKDVQVILNDFVSYDIGNNPRIKYNPRVNPYWVVEPLNQMFEDINVDGAYFNQIGSVDYKLFISKI